MQKWKVPGFILTAIWIVVLFYYGNLDGAKVLYTIPVFIVGVHLIGTYFLLGYTISAENIYLKVILGIASFINILLPPLLVYPSWF
ncbi:MAG: hypothetical protein H0Z32_01350 [Bacillaceae bacterium]|nr:hypothetical protein [Bacillaceae bacterium]